VAVDLFNCVWKMFMMCVCLIDHVGVSSSIMVCDSRELIDIGVPDRLSVVHCTGADFALSLGGIDFVSSWD
jgi:hypothetical protein